MDMPKQYLIENTVNRKKKRRKKRKRERTIKMNN